MNANQTMNADVFSRTFSSTPGAGRVREARIQVPATATLDQILAAAIAAGMNKGGRGRQQGGIFEVQTDLGIWTTDDGGKLVAGHARFATWEELEAAEA